MYNILLVDDELPALRFMETIISKYAPDYQVIRTERDGSDALAWLEEHPNDIDLLITDISMPIMNGIDLAKSARKLREDLHIIIVSGYQEFEYAKGAIEASVDDYILKPVSISQVRELLGQIKEKLDKRSGNQLNADLTALLRGKEFHPDILIKHFGSDPYFFAVVRFGNVIYPIPEITVCEVVTTYPGKGSADDFLSVISGRNEQEYIFLTPGKGSVTAFLQTVQSICVSSGFPTTSAILSRSGLEITQLGVFYQASALPLRRQTIIGKQIFHFLTLENNQEKDALSSFQPSAISTLLLKQLEVFISENDRQQIRNTFLSIGQEWDNKQVTQRQAYVMMTQLLHLVEAVRRNHWKSVDQIMMEADELTGVVNSYEEMTTRLYELLFSGDTSHSGQLSPEEMYRYALHTIEETFNHPISIQTVCSEIGISQTYLSRLFRKFGDTSFNACLTRCRMENAKKLIREHPEMPLSQVALCVGYEDYAYFSKVFRSNEGLSPSQYLAEIQNHA